MSALDQAFVKAYIRHGTAAAVPDSAPPACLPQTPRDKPQQEAAVTPQSADQPFRPMLQVDRFVWPKICGRLCRSAAEELNRLCEGLTAGAGCGQKVLAFAGCRHGDGATTMVLCAAKTLAKRGSKLIMVDANLADPRLARRLGLLPQFGWEEVLAGRLPLEEVVIESVDGCLAVLPLREPLACTDRPGKDKTRMADCIGTLAAHYDLVLVDAGELEGRETPDGLPVGKIGSRLDAVVLVHNVRATPQHRLVEVQRGLADAHIAQAGIIQNFAA